MQIFMRKHIGRLSGIVLALWLGLNLSGGAWAAPRTQSVALQQMLAQLEQVFLLPRGQNLNALIQHPPTFALLMGIMFQPQIRYAKQNPQLTGAFNRLENEAWDLVQRVARTHNYQGRIPELKQLLIDAAVGRMNAWVMQNYGVNPVALQMPSVLGPPPPQSAGKIWTGRDSNSVTLLGNQAQGFNYDQKTLNNLRTNPLVDPWWRNQTNPGKASPPPGR